MYDFICHFKHLKDLLDINQKAYYALKPNIFSLNDFKRISTRKLTRELNSVYNTILTEHILKCSICLSKGQICPICRSKDKIFPFDLRHVRYVSGKKARLCHKACYCMRKTK